ncbi:DUF5694 domain-containing protein [Pedobacter sp. AW1-32]|uniref:DUF5694 domain-containing protein n=1 Tax=Pedobacter sp. AW1-32 TaxID=3383026 RepID=UPI003FF076BD
MKTILHFFTLILFVTAFSGKASAQQQEVLLIGTFHFNNPGFDGVKTNKFDVLDKQPQAELDVLAAKIAKFNPDRFFVEWKFNQQNALDSLYQIYLNGNYQNYIDQKFKAEKSYSSYNEDEIFQLAFRSGKKAGLKTINAMDYTMDLPFDSVQKAMKNAGQTALMNEIDDLFKRIGNRQNQKMKTLGLTDLLLDLNTSASRNENAGFYLQTLNKAGKPDDFAGAYMVSEWFRRNLYMYSIVQKITQSKDKRIVILLGAGHIAMIKQFIETENRFKVIELKDILN